MCWSPGWCTFWLHFTAFHAVKHSCFSGGVGGKKKRPANAGDIRDAGSIPGLGRSPGRGHGNTLQYSWWENPMDRGAWYLQSMGSHRVDHYWSDLAPRHTRILQKMECISASLLYSPPKSRGTNSMTFESQFSSQDFTFQLRLIDYLNKWWFFY